MSKINKKEGLILNKINKNEVYEHKDKVLKNTSSYIDSLIESNEGGADKANKLCFWINDYINFLKKEKTFDPTKNIKYKKGDVVKIHLGYRVGSEQGGLHFAIVLDVNNSKQSNTITIVPLTSYKPGKRIHKDAVFLDNEIFKSLISKHDKLNEEIQSTIIECSERNLALNKKIQDANSDEEIKSYHDEIHLISNQIDTLNKEIASLGKLRKSILKMKAGSVALVNQITTVSKVRIYDPIYSNHVLYGIRLSPTTISKIDNKIADMYLSKPQKTSNNIDNI